jgi:Mitochondrial ribosomal protein L31
MSSMQKYRHRKRLQRIDRIVACVDNALAKQGMTVNAVERWKLEMPTESEMKPKDKYTMFDPKEKSYRKGVHSKFIFFTSFPPFLFVEARIGERGRREAGGMDMG